MPLSYTSFVTPTGNAAPAVHGNNFDAPFNNSATFAAGGGETCAPGEYRQYIKGTYTAGGSVVTHVLCGSVQLSPTVLQEDGCPPTGCTAYGYRACPAHPYNQFLPTRPTGCQFQMYDAPGFQGVVKGTTYKLELSFEGRLIDISRGGAILATRAWTTNGTTTVTETPTAEAPVALGAHDKIVAIHRARNVESGADELHIVVTRPPGRPPLDAGAMALTLVDATGRRVSPAARPVVHQVGNLARATASIVYTLPAGAAAPARAELAVNGGLVTLPIRDR